MKTFRATLQPILLLLLLLFAQTLMAQDKAVTAALTNYLEEQMEVNKVPGLAIALLEQGEISWIRGFGEAAPGRAVVPETAFMLGSVSKSFTGLAISQLIAQGKLDPEAPLQTYLPQFKLADSAAAASIAIKHLLQHSSGLSQAESYITSRMSQSLEQRMMQLSSATLSFAPGQQFEYANINYVLLGLVVEKLSGASYEAYVQEHIFAPLQMEHSFTAQEQAAKGGAAAGYRYWFGFPQASEIIYPQDNLPSGHLMASAADLAHYLQMLQNGGKFKDRHLIGEQQLQAMLMPPTAGFYGRGWIQGEINGIPAIYHGGAVANYNSFLVMDPDGKWAYAVLMNVNSFIANNQLRSIAEGVAPLMVQQAPPVQNFSVSRVYWLVNTLLLLWLFFFIRGLVQKYKEVSDYLWSESLSGPAKSPWKPLMYDSVVAGLLVVALPQLMNITWKQMATSQPDLVYLLLAMLLISFFSGIFLAYVRFAHSQKLKYQQKTTA